MRIPGLASLKQQKQPDHATVSLAYHELVADSMALENLISQLCNLSNVEIFLAHAEAYRKQSGCTESLESITGCSASMESVIDSIRNFFNAIFDKLAELFKKAATFLKLKKDPVPVQLDILDMPLHAAYSGDFVKLVDNYNKLFVIGEGVVRYHTPTEAKNDLQKMEHAVIACGWVIPANETTGRPSHLPKHAETFRKLGWTTEYISMAHKSLRDCETAIEHANTALSNRNAFIAEVEKAFSDGSKVDNDPEGTEILKSNLIFFSGVLNKAVNHISTMTMEYDYIVKKVGDLASAAKKDGPKKKCPSCGYMNPHDAIFCRGCGKKFT